MRAPPPPTFHTAGLKVEHMLGEREEGREGCHLGKQPSPPPRQWPSRAAGEWAEDVLIQGPANGVSLAQRCLSAPDLSALSRAQWEVFRQ